MAEKGISGFIGRKAKMPEQIRQLTKEVFKPMVKNKQLSVETVTSVQSLMPGNRKCP